MGIPNHSQLMFKALKSKIMEIEYNGCKLEVEFSIQPTEKGNGIQEHIDEISSIMYKGVDVCELLEPQQSEIEACIWEQIKYLRNEY